MNGQKASKQLKIPSILLLLAAAVAACAAAVAYREESGVFRTYPVLPLLMAAAAFLPVPWWQRGLLFLIPASALLLVGSEDRLRTVVFIILAAVLFLLTECAARLVRKKKKNALRIIACVLILLLCLGLYAAFCGNPFSAHDAQSKIEEHIGRTYVREDGFGFSGIRYDFLRGKYCVSAHSATYPTERANISVNGPMTEDRFLPLLEDQCLREPVTAVAAAFRAAFAEDVFTVYRVSAQRFDGDLPHADPSKTNYADSAVWCVELNGVPLYPQMTAKALKYANAAAASGVKASSLTFVSTQTFHTRYRVSAVPAGFTLSEYQYVCPSVFAERDEVMLGLMKAIGPGIIVPGKLF